MTALAGFWSFGPEAEVARNCDRMLQAQQLFGVRAPVVSAHGPLAMGSRTTPVAAGDESPRPLFAADRFALVADIRLDNREELAAALGLEPATWRRSTDSELLLHAWCRWEEAALQKLVGDFAVAVWDMRARRLILARDFLGQRPLCYARTRNVFAFASMPAGLHALPDIPYAPDVTQLGGFVQMSRYTGARTFFEGVERVEPGQMVVVTPDRIVSRAYWNPSLEYLKLGDPREYVEAVRETLELAVAARLRGCDQGVAAQLSAGLDSSAVVAMAARRLPPSATLGAFTSAPAFGSGTAPPGRIGDESELAAKTAAMYPNVEHVVVRETGVIRPDELDRAFLLFQRPVPNLCNYGWVATINTAARDRGFSVLLVGDAGNLSFSHSGIEHLAQLAAKGALPRLARQLRALRRNGMGWKALAAATAAPLIPRPLWKRYRRLRGQPTEAADHSLAWGAGDGGIDYAEQPCGDGIAARLSAYQASDVGNFNKGVLAGWGIDVRDPTADRRLVELCLRIPPEHFLLGGVPRGLARQVLAGLVPAAVVNERRRGYQAADWHQRVEASRSDIESEVRRLGAMAGASSILDLARATQLIARWPQADAWGEASVERMYRVALLRAVSAGHFLRRASGSNA